jgi:predicted DsbA family dithiol-disulfide isomerase
VAAKPISIDVVSDVVCPWCYLGKRRLEAALDLLPDTPVAVRWMPFRLDPTIPRQGIGREAYLTRKFGSITAVGDVHRRLTQMGRAEGIDYRFEAITRSPNTVDAHRLIRWAGPEGRQDAMVERLFAAYFTEGLDIGDAGVLVRLAAEAGIAYGDIAARLASDLDSADVAAEIDNAQRIGVTGVPCFIIDRRYGVMGAQPPDSLARAIAQASAEPAAVGATA